MATGREFVMGDIHGAYSALAQCLERCDFDRKNDTLIQLGDVTDGYPQVYECVEELLKIDHLIPIKGNHDEWLREFIDTNFHPYFWNLGGKGTLISYLEHGPKGGRFFASGSGFKTSLDSKDIPDTHKTFFRNQRLYYINERRQCFLHAGFKPNVPFLEQREEDYYWDRSLWQEAMILRANGSTRQQQADFAAQTGFDEIYIGHTPTTKSGIDKPIQACNILNIDTGAGHSGRLTIMDTATKEFWQSDPVTELYSENFRV